MRYLSLPCILLCLLDFTTLPYAHAEIVVIAGRDSPLNTVTSQEVASLYLGRNNTLGRGMKIRVFPYDMVDSQIRKDFFRIVADETLQQVDAYWALLRFSGAMFPPVKLPDSSAVIDVVTHNKNAIGYIDAALVNDSVKILLRLGE